MRSIARGDDADDRGYPNIEAKVMKAQVQAAHCAGQQVAVHGNSDAAIDQFLDSWEAAIEACAAEDARPVLVHAQMARPDQLERMQLLGVTPTFFSAHVYYWEDRHRDIFIGPERAARISPAASAAKLGLRFTTHLDTPVVPIDSIEPGKQADLVILSDNPLEHSGDLRDIRVERTLVGGVTIFENAP